MLSRSRGQTSKILITIALIVLLPLVGHKIAFNTSSSYNEMLDKRAFDKMVEFLNSEDIERIELNKSSLLYVISDFEEDIFDDIFINMSYHSSKWDDHISKWTYSARIHFDDFGRSIHFSTENIEEGVFTTYYNERSFYVTAPGIKKMIQGFKPLHEN